MNGLEEVFEDVEVVVSDDIVIFGLVLGDFMLDVVGCVFVWVDFVVVVVVV